MLSLAHTPTHTHDHQHTHTPTHTHDWQHTHTHRPTHTQDQHQHAHTHTHTPTHTHHPPQHTHTHTPSSKYMRPVMSSKVKYTHTIGLNKLLGPPFQSHYCRPAQRPQDLLRWASTACPGGTPLGF